MQVIDIDFKVGDFWLFKALTTRFSKGIIVISGNNGCGKSTLLRILSGLCKPSRGMVLYENKDLYANPLVIKQMIGYVPSTPFLYPQLTLFENVTLAAKIRQLSEKEIKANLPLVFEQCQLTGYEKSLFGNCSDGIKKQAMLASALIHHPKLLILDEPGATLSPSSRELLWQVLNRLAAQGFDIILSSHYLEDINHCKEHYVLEAGRLHLQANMRVFSHIVLTQNNQDSTVAQDVSL